MAFAPGDDVQFRFVDVAHFKWLAIDEQAGEAPWFWSGVEGLAGRVVDACHSTALTPATAATIHRLASLEPAPLGPMHGPAFRGDGERALRALAYGYVQCLQAAVDN